MFGKVSLFREIISKMDRKKKYFDFGDGKVHDDIIHRSGGGRVWSKGVELVQVNSTFNKLE